MLPGLTVPASLAGVLQGLRPSFTAPSFATFTLLVVGMVAQTGPRTVCGMLLGAGLQAVVSHHRLHRFFSVTRWSADALGLVLGRLVVERLLPAGAALDVAVAAYHGRPLRDLPDRVTFATRVQRNAVLYAPAPPPTGKRGRPRTRGDRIGNPTQAGAGASWRQTSVTRYGRTDTVAVAEVACLWYGAFGKRRGRLVLVGDSAGATTRELALFTTDLTSTVEQIVARYAGRWSVEMCQPQ